MVVEQRPNSNEGLTCLCRIKKPKIPIKCLLSKNDAAWTSIVELILHFLMDFIQFHFLSPNSLRAIFSILRPMKPFIGSPDWQSTNPPCLFDSCRLSIWRLLGKCTWSKLWLNNSPNSSTLARKRRIKQLLIIFDFVLIGSWRKKKPLWLWSSFQVCLKNYFVVLPPTVRFQCQLNFPRSSPRKKTLSKPRWFEGESGWFTITVPNTYHSDLTIPKSTEVVNTYWYLCIHIHIYIYAHIGLGLFARTVTTILTTIWSTPQNTKNHTHPTTICEGFFPSVMKIMPNCTRPGKQGSIKLCISKWIESFYCSQEEKATLPRAPLWVPEFSDVAVQYPRPGWGRLTPFPFEGRSKARVCGTCWHITRFICSIRTIQTYYARTSARWCRRFPRSTKNVIQQPPGIGSKTSWHQWPAPTGLRLHSRMMRRFPPWNASLGIKRNFTRFF